VVNGEQSGTLTLNVLDTPCRTIITCGDYAEQSICESDVCQVASDSVPQAINCSDPDINCYCTQNVDTCVGAFSSLLDPTPFPPVSGDGIISVGETCDSSEWGGITGCADFDAFTGGSLSCDSTGHFDTSLCTGGNGPGVYGDGIINLGETCDGSEWGPITGCADFDEFTGGVLSCDSPGNFNTFQCTVKAAGELGTCLITEGNVDENGCDDGFLTIEWTGQWVWNEEENPGHEDPKGLSSLCVNGGTRVIECPAQIKLPFFGLYNIIATILLVTVIYFILIRKNKKEA